ncbi:MAG: hypothetical protein ACHQTF_09790 [Gemmatimonadales bacterium]
MHRLLTSVTRVVIAASLPAVLAACASSGAPSPDDHPPTDRIVATDPNGRVIHTTDYYNGTEATFHAPPSSVMATLSQVYPDLGIPVGTMVSTTGQVGNTNYRVPGHRLKAVQLSRILECGTESMSGSLADIDEVTISVLSTIKPVGDSGSVVSTFLTGTARPLGTSSDAVQCATNGVLERMINDRVVKALGGSAVH